MNAKVQNPPTIPATEVAPEDVQALLRSEPPVPPKDAEQPRIQEEVVIEEVSIDGMCGVY
jgi:mycofactocin precursor